MQPIQVAVVAGSLRKKSFSRQLANAMARLAAPGLLFKLVEIGEVPFYNEDLESETPAAWSALRAELRGAQAALFITPEYNRSVPAVLKNAVDVLSRPYGKSALTDLPGAVVSVSQGAMGGFGANHHLRQSLVALGVKTMPTPEAYVGAVANLFDAEGGIANRGTEEFLRQFLASFERWIAANPKA